MFIKTGDGKITGIVDLSELTEKQKETIKKSGKGKVEEQVKPEEKKEKK